MSSYNTHPSFLLTTANTQKMIHADPPWCRRGRPSAGRGNPGRRRRIGCPGSWTGGAASSGRSSTPGPRRTAGAGRRPRAATRWCPPSTPGGLRHPEKSDWPWFMLKPGAQLYRFRHKINSTIILKMINCHYFLKQILVCYWGRWGLFTLCPRPPRLRHNKGPSVNKLQVLFRNARFFLPV